VTQRHIPAGRSPQWSQDWYRTGPNTHAGSSTLQKPATRIS